jgi:hypothetical protein
MRQKQLIYFRYNVPAHSARIVKRFHVNRGVAEISHLPHSLDVAILDFFPKVKTVLKRRRLQDFEDVKFDVNVELNAVNLDAFHNCNF